jgi:ribokinase
VADIRITVMGIFVADIAFRTSDLPAWGQTVLGAEYRLGPGGKGSNQAVAAARLGGAVSFICRVGRDPFGDLARATWRGDGIDTEFCLDTPGADTGAAAIVVHPVTGENAIVAVPGASSLLSAADVDRAAGRIAASAVFVTQLEVPVAVAEHGLRLAHQAGVPTILNAAPARPLSRHAYGYCDYLTPNESEAAALTGQPVEGPAGAARAADILLARGCRNVVITLGKNGALARNAERTEHVPAFDAGPVVETTGAGDAFTGALAIAVAEGLDLFAATRFGCAAAGIAVTRQGTARAMPTRAEVDALLRAAT